MKRFRDDVRIDSPIKRQGVSSRAELPGQCQSQIIGGSKVRKLTSSDAMTYLKSVKDKFRDRKDKYDEFIEVMKDFKSHRIDTPGFIKRVKQLFVGQGNLIRCFNTFLPKGWQFTLAPEDRPLLTKKHVQIDAAFSFVGKIKAKLQGDNHVFKSFLRILKMYEMENMSIVEVYKEVSELLRDHPDLLSEFTLFLPFESVAATSHGSQACRDSSRDDSQSPMNESWNNRQFPGSVKIEDHHGREGGRNKVDGYKGNHLSEQHKYDNGVHIFSQEASGQKVPIYSREKYDQKSIQELDLSNCESCTPSYRLLPKDYPIPSVSHKTDIGTKVLNDRWVSVTSGIEDYSFKHMRKNQYEESLSRCEDDRYDMDMLLESVASAIKRVEELLDKINDNAIDTDSPIHIEDHFTVLNLRCIERLYGDHGLEVMDGLRENPPLVLPVILTRLKQKQEEWARCGSKFNKIWTETYSKNHHKSLDHRSFYFKQ